MKKLLGLSLIVAALGGCVTPVIPLPPPDPTKMTFEVTGTAKDQVTITGAASAVHNGGYIYLINMSTGRGVITQTGEDGSFKAEPIKAQDKDQLHMWAARGPDDPSSEVTCGLLDFASGRVLRCY